MPEARTTWKRVTLAGALIAAFGAVYFAISATYSSFDVVLPAIGIGLMTVTVGLIGWAATLGRRDRARIAGLALLPPAFVVIIGVFTDPNVHGIFPLFFIACIPLFLAGIVLGIMALAARRP